KFKKPASPQLTTVPVSPKEPTRKTKRVKRPTKKSTNAPTAGVVIRDTPMMSLSKKKEKMTVEKHKGIDLLYEVALTKEAQYEEVRKKSLRDFHKTHPSGSGIVTKIAPSVAKIKPSGRDEDDSNNDHDSSSEGSDQESDSGDDNTQSDKEKGSDSEHETDENETGSESDQEENEEEVEDDEEEKEDEFVKTPSNYKAEGATQKWKWIILTTFQTISLWITRSRPTRDEFMSYISTSITARITKQVKIQLPLILPKKVSNFAPLVIKIIVTESLEHAVLAKESSQPHLHIAACRFIEFELNKILIEKIDESQSYLTTAEHRECYDGLIKSYDLDKSLFSTYNKVYSLKRSRKDKDKDEDPSAGSDRGLKKRKTRKDAEPTKGPKAKESQSGSSKGTQSQSKSSRKSVQVEEPKFEVADTDMPQDQEEIWDHVANFEWSGMRSLDVCGSKPVEEVYLLVVTNARRGEFINFDSSYNQGKLVHEMGIVKCARGLESRHDVYSTKRILAVTRVEVMRKHMYGYLREIEVRKTDNELYTFKEGDFPRLRINDIEDMLILTVQNRLTNLLGDDVADFAIALE
ncbi:hypothetical protein Tco_0864667, partial [Tanacetum coccineum]